jgi:hypothetical protein
MRAPMAAVACTLAAAAALSGCRSSQPLAPKAEVDGVLSNIGIYCGEATQLEDFPGHGRRIRQLDSAALGEAHHLIRIMRSGPSATYYGQSMRRVVSTASTATAGCRLGRTSSALGHAVAG